MLKKCGLWMRTIDCVKNAKLFSSGYDDKLRVRESEKEPGLSKPDEEFDDLMKRQAYKSPLGLPWHEREETYNSWTGAFNFNVDVSSPDFMRMLQTDIDYRPKTIKKWLARKHREIDLVDQRYIEDRHRILGSDLAAAHFVINRGGGVKFCGEKDFVRRKEDRTYDLPCNYVAGLYVEAIDAKGMVLYYEGLVNIMGLSKLTWLSLEGGKHVDDWCIDKISCDYQKQLEYLSVSDCPNITYRGLSALYRMEELQTLEAAGCVSESPEFKLACLMLEDILPKLQIKGVKYDLDVTLLQDK